MSRNFTLGQLTEGIRDRNVGQDGGRLINKWTRTGLLRGLNEHKRENMARLLENQAAQVLREANVLSGGASGNIDGFSNIAFPIVRRVFGGLVANELVSIQPMSLPSGLLFYLDYSYGTDVGHIDSDGGNAKKLGSTTSSVATAMQSGESLYGSPSGNSIRTGADATGGMYDLAGSGYSRPYKDIQLGSGDLSDAADSIGSFDSSGTWVVNQLLDATTIAHDANQKLVQYDPQLIREIQEGYCKAIALVLDTSNMTGVDFSLLKSFALLHDDGTDTDINAQLTHWDNDSKNQSWQNGLHLFNLKRLNQRISWVDADNTYVAKPLDGGDVLFIVKASATYSGTLTSDIASVTLVAPISDSVVDANTDAPGSTLVVPSFESDFNADPAPIIPEIDIKIESIAVTAQTRKLRARWSPELAQDLNAYHSLDAEVELTQILSEQIALEIDREILNDLLVEAQGANFFWSRAPGKFVNKRSGAAQNLASSLATGPQFTGTVREWYETLVETIIDVANEIHRKTLRGSANFIVVSPEVATIFEASVLYKPSIKIDGQGQVATPFSLGAEAIGSLSNRFTVYKDPYFPRNKILVGYKGGSYLESGYVYAPYVPLIVTPTIFAPEDFTPRKGVMTRYGKKMVRADFYGTVTCLDMDVI